MVVELPPQLRGSFTVKLCVVTQVPFGVVTEIGPVVAPSGTFTQIPWFDTTLNCVAAVTLNATAVGPSRLPPQSMIRWPADPACGTKRPTCGLGGGNPASSTKTVPPP